jgi:hypothetical protein
VFQAKLGDDGRYQFTWNGIAVELGVRRCFTTPVLAPEHHPHLRPVRPLRQAQDRLRQAQDERVLGNARRLETSEPRRRRPGSGELKRAHRTGATHCVDHA